MQQAYQEAISQFGVQLCLGRAIDDTRSLFNALRQLQDGNGSAEQAAIAIGRLEVACEQLRLIVGSGLVDLHKLSAFSLLLEQLRTHQSKQMKKEDL